MIKHIASKPQTPEPTATAWDHELADSAHSAFQRAEIEAKLQEPQDPEFQAKPFHDLGVESLLLGILAEATGPAADLFSAFHINRESLRQEILTQITPRS